MTVDSRQANTPLTETGDYEHRKVSDFDLPPLRINQRPDRLLSRATCRFVLSGM